jgi:hypothetical protein
VVVHVNESIYSSKLLTNEKKTTTQRERSATTTTTRKISLCVRVDQKDISGDSKRRKKKGKDK